MTRYDLLQWYDTDPHMALLQDGDYVYADEALARIAELERERDEARSLVKEFLHSESDSCRHVLLKCQEAVKRWEVRGEY